METTKVHAPRLTGEIMSPFLLGYIITNNISMALEEALVQRSILNLVKDKIISVGKQVLSNFQIHVFTQNHRRI